MDRFWHEFAALDRVPCRLLECGSRRRPGQPPGAASSAHAWKEGVEVVGLDCQSGEGVDFVADLHDLAGLALAGGDFDAVLCCSTLEHCRRPWVVAEQLARVTRPGGVLFCQTHFLFPRHSWPGDYFRFTKEGLAEVFGEDAGWQVLDSGEEYPALVVPLSNAWAHGAKGWNFEPEKGHLNVYLTARRL